MMGAHVQAPCYQLSPAIFQELHTAGSKASYSAIANDHGPFAHVAGPSPQLLPCIVTACTDHRLPGPGEANNCPKVTL